jgi:hypothetical protein
MTRTRARSFEIELEESDRASVRFRDKHAHTAGMTAPEVPLRLGFMVSFGAGPERVPHLDSCGAIGFHDFANGHTRGRHTVRLKPHTTENTKTF